MKKVLFLITTLDGGGAEKVLQTISKNLDKSKYDITVMTITDTGVYRDEVKKHVKYNSIFKELKSGRNIFEKIYNIIYQNLYKEFMLKHPQLLYKLFIKGKFDIEVSFLENICSKIIANSINDKSQKYLWIHTDLEKSNWCKNQFNGIDDQIKTYDKFDKIYCVSRDVKLSFNKVFGLEEKTYIQYNPNDEREIIKLSNESIKDVDINKKFKFITSGRFIEQKGFGRLLEAHKILLNEGYDYELWILGDVPEKKKYEKFIKNNGIQKNTMLLGFKSNPYKYLNECHVFVCSSRVEGYSLVVAEAIILNIPVISTECSGPSELLNYGKDGLIVENSNYGIYNGMKILLDNKDKYNYYKKRVSERSKDFKLEKSMKEIESILDGYEQVKVR